MWLALDEGERIYLVEKYHEASRINVPNPTTHAVIHVVVENQLASPEVAVDVVALIGRILFAAIFLASSYGHLTQTEALAGYAGSKGVPQPKLATLAGGVLMVVGILMIVLGIWADLGALLLVLFLLPTALIMHAFWRETDGQAQQQEREEGASERR